MSQPVETGRQRFGRYVRQRRESMGLSLNEIADRAGMHRTTWSAIERATGRAPEGYTLGRVESALGWTAGSANAILAGGDPLVSDQPAANRSGTDAIDQWESDLVRDIQADRRLSPEQKLDLVKQTRQSAVQQRAALQEAQLERSAIEDRIRLLRNRRAG